MPTTTKTKTNSWRQQISQARCEHRHTLGMLLSKAKSEVQFATFEKKLQHSLSAVEAFNAAPLTVTFNDDLPISQRREEIAELIRNNQVVIVAGETGSGKTTQLPKLCLSLGYGNRGLIGHTQPRRIAARTVAARIAEELKSPLGETVGYQIRFKDQSSDKTQIKLMTDGVLLAEMQRDRFLSRYEVIIIDEAHERSLNIDLLLGLLKPLCAKRPDLKIIITSATIDLQKFSQHFSVKDKPAPIMEVSGRMFPVDVLYQASEQTSRSEKPELAETICQTVQQIIRQEARGEFRANGDILVFCASEHDIRTAAKTIRQADLPVDVLPLYSRLSVQEQDKVFKPSQRRKVVLATNVAETSITVPGIAYVIDPGLARISRYSFRSKVQRLPIEDISQASANQRMGRCGRVANGVCIRLYTEEDFNARPAFTSAEILRSNLASVILQMLRLGIHDLQNFEFIDKPDKRLLNDGFKLLEEIGAIDKQQRLSKIGNSISNLPVDPRFARILLAAHELGCLHDALVVISALSIRDPRERPADKQAAADAKHRELQHPQSDFFTYLMLWQSIDTHRSNLTNSKFKQHCVQNYWSIGRIFEWRELLRQLQQACKQNGWQAKQWQALDISKDLSQNANKQKSNPQAKPAQFDKRYETLHQALISGLTSNLANQQPDGIYAATRGRTVQIFPASALAKRKPKWILGAELIETSRLFLHTVAEINPQWVTQQAIHLCRYSYSDPHYDERSGKVNASRKTMFFGLTLREKEKIGYQTIDPSECRSIFIQQALVNARYKDKQKDGFLQHNQQLIEDIEKLEVKTRKRNLLVDEAQILAFYNSRIPIDISDRVSFDKWRKTAEHSNPNVLKLSREQLLVNEIDDDALAQFPDHLLVNGKRIKVTYRFEPSSPEDGVCVHVPIALLSVFPTYLGEWLVPGLLREKCIALLKTLPKSVRKHYAPAADSVDRVIHQLHAQNLPLSNQLGELLYKTRGVKIDDSAWDESKLDAFYQVTYRVLDDDGEPIATGTELAQLRQAYAHSVKQSIAVEKSPQRLNFERHNLTTWEFGDLPKTFTYQHQGMSVRAFPMLKACDDGSVSLLLSESEGQAIYHSRRGIVAMAVHASALKQSMKYLNKELFANKSQGGSMASDKPSANGMGALAKQLKNVTTKPAEQHQWRRKVIEAAIWQSCFVNLKNLHTRQQFESAIKGGAKALVSTALELEAALLTALQSRDELLARIDKLNVRNLQEDQRIEDIKQQLYGLFDPTFLRYTTVAQLKQYPRYLRAVALRLDRLADDKLHGAAYAALTAYQTGLAKALALRHQVASDLQLDYSYLDQPAYFEFAVLLEEWRVSMFAQHLKTRMPVSEQRAAKAWHSLTSDQ